MANTWNLFLSNFWTNGIVSNDGKTTPKDDANNCYTSALLPTWNGKTMNLIGENLVSGCEFGIYEYSSKGRFIKWTGISLSNTTSLQEQITLDLQTQYFIIEVNKNKSYFLSPPNGVLRVTFSGERTEHAEVFGICKNKCLVRVPIKSDFAVINGDVTIYNGKFNKQYGYPVGFNGDNCVVISAGVCSDFENAFSFYNTSTSIYDHPSYAMSVTLNPDVVTLSGLCSSSLNNVKRDIIIVLMKI